MAYRLIEVPTEKCDYPSQPRSKPDPAYCRSLGESMKAIGQKVPILGYTESTIDRFIVSDGGCRLEGARLCGIATLLAMDLGKKPTPIELLMGQASIDILKQHFPVMDRARLWHSIKEMRACTAKQLAREFGVSDSGALQLSKASFIAQQESDPARQRELAALGRDMSRNELAAKVKQTHRNGQQTPAVKLARVKIAMPEATLVITGQELSMAGVVELLSETLKEARKAADQFDVKTWVRMMADKSKAR